MRPVGSISVDVRPLLAQGLGGYAEALQAELTGALQAEFAGSLRPGERIVVLLRSISLATYVGDINVFQLSDNDYLDGVVTLVGPNGQELATKDILAVSLASSGGPWYIQGARAAHRGFGADLRRLGSPIHPGLISPKRRVVIVSPHGERPWERLM